MRQTVNPVQLLWAPGVFSLGECNYPYTAHYFPISMSGSTAIGKGAPILSYITPTRPFTIVIGIVLNNEELRYSVIDLNDQTN